MGHGIGAQAVRANTNEKYDKMRNSKEYKKMYAKNIAWLKQLDATDSSPNNGRVDISVFNAKVAKNGYKEYLKCDSHSYLPGSKSISKEVLIEELADNMTYEDYSRKFGL